MSKALFDALQQVMLTNDLPFPELIQAQIKAIGELMIGLESLSVDSSVPGYMLIPLVLYFGGSLTAVLTNEEHRQLQAIDKKLAAFAKQKLSEPVTFGKTLYTYITRRAL